MVRWNHSEEEGFRHTREATGISEFGSKGGWLGTMPSDMKVFRVRLRVRWELIEWQSEREGEKNERGKRKREKGVFHFRSNDSFASHFNAMSCLSTPLRFLPVLPTELQLSTVLKSGQSFRWNRSTTLYATLPDHSSDSTSPYIAPQSESEEWSFGWQERTVVLRQDG